MKTNHQIPNEQDPLPEIIEAAGRRAPFSVPEGYFDTLHDRVMDRIDAESQNVAQAPRTFRFIPYRLRAVAAAAALLLLAGFTYALVTRVIIPVVQEYRNDNTADKRMQKPLSQPVQSQENQPIAEINPSETHDFSAPDALKGRASDHHSGIAPKGATSGNQTKGSSSFRNPALPASSRNSNTAEKSSAGTGKWPFADTLVCRGTLLRYTTPYNPAEYTHEWLLNSKPIGNTQGSTLLLSTQSMAAGVHRLSLVVRDRDFNGIAAVVNAGITVSEAPALTGDRKICAYEKAVLKTGSRNPYWIYQWSSGESTPEISVTTSGKYWVRVQVAGGNCSTTDTFEVTVLPKPVVYLGSDRNICTGDKVTLNVKNTDSRFKIRWSPGQEESSAQYFFSQNKPGLYKIRVEVTGCQLHSDEITIQVSDCSLIIPNIFTPNGDGRNDRFVIAGAEAYDHNRLVVTDRNGVVVYESSDYRNDWDGGDQPNGTYFYLFYPGGNQNNFRKGTVMIMR